MWTDAFAAPVVLPSLAAALALAVWLTWPRRGRAAVPVHPIAAAVTGGAGWRVRLRHLPDVLRWLAVASGIVALAGPLAWRDARSVQRGADVMLLVDVSGSMQALDFSPDRLGAARHFADDLVRRRPDDRFGVASFASRSALRCPLTRDHAAVRAALRDLAPGTELLGDGTALGAAIINAVERLSAGDAPERMLLVLSDGQGVREVVPPLEAAALAAERRVRIVTVGIGSGGPVPYPTEFGRIDVRLPLDVETLTALAERTHGRYFAAPDASALAAVADAVQQLEAAAPPEVVRPERFGLADRWIALALGFVCVEWWLAATLLRRYPA